MQPRNGTLSRQWISIHTNMQRPGSNLTGSMSRPVTSRTAGIVFNGTVACGNFGGEGNLMRGERHKRQWTRGSTILILSDHLIRTSATHRRTRALVGRFI